MRDVASTLEVSDGVLLSIKHTHKAGHRKINFSK